jgi:hypothetical protein
MHSICRGTVNVLRRNFVTKTRVTRGGAGHGDKGHLHGDHSHHPHLVRHGLFCFPFVISLLFLFLQMFNPPFNKRNVAFYVGGCLFGGIGIICGITYFQNYKHGFLSKK